MNLELRKQYPGLRRKRYRLRRELHALDATSAAPAPGADPAEVEKLKSKNESLIGKVKQIKDQMLRARADYENFRKRVQQQQKMLEDNAAEQVVQPLLSVLDHFSLALENSAEIQNAESFVDGIKMIYRELQKALSEIGLHEIPAQGKPFDPHMHEAVGLVDDPDLDENTIVNVIRKGYKLGDRVIRPTLAHVSRKPQEAPDEEDE